MTFPWGKAAKRPDEGTQRNNSPIIREKLFAPRCVARQADIICLNMMQKGAPAGAPLLYDSQLSLHRAGSPAHGRDLRPAIRRRSCSEFWKTHPQGQRFVSRFSSSYSPFPIGSMVWLSIFRHCVKLILGYSISSTILLHRIFDIVLHFCTIFPMPLCVAHRAQTRKP